MKIEEQFLTGMEPDEPKQKKTEELRDKTVSDTHIDWRSYRSPEKRNTDSVEETCIECETKGRLSCSKHGRK